MIRFILILLLAGCANLQTAEGHIDHPPKPELVGRDVQAIQEGMQRRHPPARTEEMVTPARRQPLPKP